MTQIMILDVQETARLALASSSTAAAQDKAGITAAMNAWKAHLEAACDGGAVEPLLSLYAPDCMLWGTLSPQMRSDRAGLEAYFRDACCMLPKVEVRFCDPLIRIHGDTAINTGAYVFDYEREGQPARLVARYSFVLVRRGGVWLIADHHSSKMPEPSAA
jgi:uncharacterized protein (TIGR02246 family)